MTERSSGGKSRAVQDRCGPPGRDVDSCTSVVHPRGGVGGEGCPVLSPFSTLPSSELEPGSLED